MKKMNDLKIRILDNKNSSEYKELMHLSKKYYCLNLIIF